MGPERHHGDRQGRTGGRRGDAGATQTKSAHPLIAGDSSSARGLVVKKATAGSGANATPGRARLTALAVQLNSRMRYPTAATSESRARPGGRQERPNTDPDRNPCRHGPGPHQGDGQHHRAGQLAHDVGDQPNREECRALPGVDQRSHRRLVGPGGGEVGECIEADHRRHAHQVEGRRAARPPSPRASRCPSGRALPGRASPARPEGVRSRARPSNPSPCDARPPSEAALFPWRSPPFNGVTRYCSKRPCRRRSARPLRPPCSASNPSPLLSGARPVRARELTFGGMPVPVPELGVPGARDSRR